MMNIINIILSTVMPVKIRPDHAQSSRIIAMFI